MCFSAGASFGAGAILSVIGVAAFKKVRSPKQIIFASIPLIFAVQQTNEGFLWLALSHPPYAFLQQFTTFVFLFFAQIVWPVWVPLAVFMLETDEKRKRMQKVLFVTGSLVSIYLAFCLVSYHVEAKIIGYHISYMQDYPNTLRSLGIFYIIVTIVPPFISTVKWMWLLGTAILVSYIITAIFYRDYIVSVWCFFASIISLAIFLVLYRMDKERKETAMG